MQKDKHYFETMLRKYQELNNHNGIKAMQECLAKYNEQKTRQLVGSKKQMEAIKMQNKLKEEEARESMKFKDCNQDMIIGYVIETVPKRKKGDKKDGDSQGKTGVYIRIHQREKQSLQ